MIPEGLVISYSMHMLLLLIASWFARIPFMIFLFPFYLFLLLLYAYFTYPFLIIGSFYFGFTNDLQMFYSWYLHFTH